MVSCGESTGLAGSLRAAWEAAPKAEDSLKKIPSSSPMVGPDPASFRCGDYIFVWNSGPRGEARPSRSGPG
jgi:hypothetical protein